MLNKKDPLIDAIQQVMQSNQADRNAVKAVNEKFGIQDRKVLPRERQGEWDAAYKSVLSEGLHPNQQKLDVHEPEKDKLTKHDFKMLRAKKKPMEEGSDITSPSSMGISKPDYATGTPDYAKSKEQVPNRAAKTSLPAGTMKEEEQIDEKAPPGAKYERMVKHIKDKMSKGGLSKKEKSIAYATAWKSKKKDVNEGFNDRHDSSVNASANKQVVAEAAKARSDYGLGAAAAPKNAAADRAKIDTAMEPVVNTMKAVTPGATAFDKATQGDYKGAAVDAAIDVAGGAAVGGAYRLGKGLYNLARGSKAAAGAEKAVAATTKALPSPATAPVKPVSQAAKEPAASVATKGSTAVDNFISKAKSTPVSPAARETGAAGQKAAANASKYSKPGTAGGRFSDKLAQARKGSDNYGPSKGGVAVRKTTEPATVTRPGVPAVAKKPGVPAVANRPGLPARVGTAATKVAGRTSNLKDIGTKAAVGLGVGAAMYGLSNKNQPNSTQAATPPATAAKQAGGSTPSKTQAVKPGTAKPTSAKPVSASPAVAAVKSRLQTRNQRDDTIGASGRSTKGPGGVTSGTKTGKTITNRPVVAKKAPVGTGRVK